MDYRDIVTDALDVLGVLALAAGAAAGLWQWLSWGSLAVGGVVVLASVRVYEQVEKRRTR